MIFNGHDRKGVWVRGEALTLVEREEISRGVAEDVSARTIAKRLGRDPSVISREIARNGGREKYRAHEAAERAERAALRPKPRKLEANRQPVQTQRSRLPERSAGQHSCADGGGRMVRHRWRWPIPLAAHGNDHQPHCAEQDWQ